MSGTCPLNDAVLDFYSLSETAISIVTLLPNLPGNVSPTCGNAAFEKCTMLRLPHRPEKVEQLLSFSFDLSHTTFFLFLDQNFKMPLLNQFFMDFPEN